jgi:heme-degrading monooxygenase HmoA
MYVRSVTFEGVSDLDALVAHLDTDALPRLAQARGFRAVNASASRTARKASVQTTWETENDLDASEALALDGSRQALDATGGHALPFQRFELLHEEIGDKPPTPGCALVVTTTKMAPANVDTNLAHFRSRVVPAMRASRGFRAARSLTNRETGEGRVGTVWEDELCLEQWLARADQLRANLSSGVDIEFGDRFRLEVIYSHLS